jgi:primosomal protein N' (replication factor Y)
LSTNVYANVIVDIEAAELKDKLFTYEVQPGLESEAFIGAQVLVPFGSQQVGGVILSLSDSKDDRLKTVKQISEVIDTEPLFDREYIEFLYWIADYYCARVGDVISAAIPSSFAAKYKKTISLVSSSRSEEVSDAVLNVYADPFAKTILQSLQESKQGSLALSTLKQRCRRLPRFNSASFYRAINNLKIDGLIRSDEERHGGMTAKTVTNILWSGAEPKNKRQKEIIALLQSHGGQLPLREFLELASTTYPTVKRLVADGVLKRLEVEETRNPLAHLLQRLKETTSQFVLTDEQQMAFDVLGEALRSQLNADQRQEVHEQHQSQKNRPQNHQPKDDRPAVPMAVPKPLDAWLLHGVTGSGKTEIYLRLIQEALTLGKSSILLVPEISLTPQLARRLTERFENLVAIWHSALSAGEKFDTWRKLRSGEVRVLLGARSAILACMPELGLIILDEEHDGSYKQTSPSPRYSAKEAALEKGRRAGAMVLLGSATPDISTYKNARDRGRCVRLSNRVHKQAMPHVDIIDMRDEFRRNNRSIFADSLKKAIAESLSASEQIILLMNRRGFASHVFCRACGHVLRCKNCSVSLVFHQQRQDDGAKEDTAAGHLACHHCGYRRSAVSDCPSCRSPFIKQFGLGTQRVETEVRELFPNARVVRLDSDVTANKGTHDEILQGFAEGNADILIGTQMVAKGLDIANVTLVGVLAADTAFNMPDYRSVERGFQLLTQVSGRTGRGDKIGRVIWQTYNTEMPVLSWAKQHDYEQFAEEELRAREAFNYPPFSQLIRVVVAGARAQDVERECDLLAEEIAHLLADEFPESAIQVLGPAPCVIERLRGKFRFHLLIKNFAGVGGHRVLTDFLRSKKLPEGLVLAVDVDALDLL